MGVIDKLKGAKKTVKKGKKKYSSFLDALFGENRGSSMEKGERLAGGSWQGKEVKDRLIDRFGTHLDPEEQEILKEEIDKQIKKNKRKRVRTLARKELEKEIKKKRGSSMSLVGSGSTDKKEDKNLGYALSGLGGKKIGPEKKDEEESFEEAVGGLI